MALGKHHKVSKFMGCRVLQKVCVFIILWMFNLCNLLLSCLSPKRVCLTPQTSTGEIMESGYKGMGGVTSMQIDVVIYCFIVIQIKGMIYEWEFKRNQVACLHTILSEKHSQSCLCLPLRLWWRCYYCYMMQRKQEKVFYAVNWSVQMKMSPIAEDDWIWWPVKVPTHTAWSNAVVSIPDSFAVPYLLGSGFWIEESKM